MMEGLRTVEKKGNANLFTRTRTSKLFECLWKSNPLWFKPKGCQFLSFQLRTEAIIWWKVLRTFWNKLWLYFHLNPFPFHFAILCVGQNERGCGDNLWRPEENRTISFTWGNAVYETQTTAFYILLHLCVRYVQCMDS